MANDKKTSIIKEALTEYNEIREAADANAKKKLAEEFPEKFNNLLKEEINKNKSKKESYKKLDEAKESDNSDENNSNKESVMKNQTKETTKVVKENAGKDGVYTEKPKMPDMVKEEREKEFMGDVEGETPNLGKGETEDGNTFVEKIKTKKETLANKTSIKEEFDITELDMSSVGSALENAGEEDEVITMDEIEEEISQMNNLGEELSDMGGLPRPELGGQRGKATGNNGDAFSQLVSMRNQIDEMINGMNPESEVDADSSNLETELGESEEITDADVMAVLGGNGGEQEVDEAHGVTYGNRRNTVGRHTPAPEYLSQGELDQSPEYVQESKKKINSLINENKSLTKKLNETKKYKQSVSTLVEQYKSVLEKYRNQLKEMATFNTNLAHVNNLLVNESLALTQEDKIKIINGFKKVDTIAESQKKYKEFLTEMKGSKKTLTESIEGKVTASVAPSSKQKLDEAKEVTAYENNDHLKRMKRIIETIEHRGKKNNL